MRIEPFAFQHASQKAYRSYYTLKEMLRAERMPDMPPILLEESINRLQNVPDYLDMHIWVGWDDSQTQMVAIAESILLQTEENQHIMPFSIGVHPDFRKQGIGKEMLARVATLAEKEGRRFLITTTHGSVPAGGKWMERIEATPGLETHMHKLSLADIDHHLLNAWQKPDKDVASRFELGLWSGPFPEGELPAIARLMAILNEEPKGRLFIEDVQYSPERVREMDRVALAGNIERWVLYARERKTKQLVGYTAVYFRPDQPHQVGQGDTGVFPQFRRQGIGRWLKAAMIGKILRERPEAQFILTSNADSNESMLKINHALGYKSYLSKCVWQVELDTVNQYLRRTKVTP